MTAKLPNQATIVDLIQQLQAAQNQPMWRKSLYRVVQARDLKLVLSILEVLTDPKSR